MDVTWTLRPPDTAKLRDFLWLGVEPDVVGARMSGTLLAEAATWGHVEALDVLLQAGGRIDAANGEGWTALMVAAAWNPGLQLPVPDNNGAVVKFLLDRGAAQIDAVGMAGRR